MKYEVRHGTNCDYHKLQLKSLTITAIFWTFNFWDWDWGFAWEPEFKGFLLPCLEVFWSNHS